MNEDMDSLRYLVSEFSTTPERQKRVLLGLINKVIELEDRISAMGYDLAFHNHRDDGSSSLLVRYD